MIGNAKSFCARLGSSFHYSSEYHCTAYSAKASATSAFHLRLKTSNFVQVILRKTVLLLRRFGCQVKAEANGWRCPQCLNPFLLTGSQMGHRHRAPFQGTNTIEGLTRGSCCKDLTTCFTEFDLNLVKQPPPLQINLVF